MGRQIRFLACISQDLQTPAGHNHSKWPWTVELGADSIMEVGTKDIAWHLQGAWSGYSSERLVLRRNSACEAEDKETRTRMGEVEPKEPKGFHGCLSLCQPPSPGGLQKEQVPFRRESWPGLRKPQPSCSPQPTKEAGAKAPQGAGPNSHASHLPAAFPNCKQLLTWPTLTQNHTWNGILGKVVPTTKLTCCTFSAASSRDIFLGNFPGFTVLELNPSAWCDSAQLWAGVSHLYQWKHSLPSQPPGCSVLLHSSIIKAIRSPCWEYNRVYSTRWSAFFAWCLSKLLSNINFSRYYILKDEKP